MKTSKTAIALYAMLFAFKDFGRTTVTEKQCNINSVSNYFHCQREEEMESKCTNQCDHCKEYYKPLEQ